MPAPPIGTRFGDLVVISERHGPRRLMVTCRCDCGNEKAIRYDHLSNEIGSGKTTSCGHAAKSNALKHGLKDAPEYGVWQQMINRCHKPGKQSHNYKDRGIYVCDRWRYSFENFIADMGRRPGGEREYTIERIDNNGPYEPGNCRWATYKEQARNARFNRLLTYEGRTMSMAAWAEERKINPGTLKSRLDHSGWPLGKALGFWT